MSDIRSMDRESKKRQLRSNIVQISNQNRPVSYEEEEDSEDMLDDQEKPVEKKPAIDKKKDYLVEYHPRKEADRQRIVW
mgnify:CR=1 FL=1